MITVSNITKTFGTMRAVSDVSFELATGEVTVLLGPNGAGKTTTMRVMVGYYVPDAGSVTIDGISLLENPLEAKGRIGYLPESNPLYRDMLVSEYLTFSAHVMGLASKEHRPAFDRVVAETGIDEVFYKPISELSKGFRQRVGLAGTLVSDPAVLVLDEPTEGLDPNQRIDMRELLAKLARNKTVLVSTHVLSEAEHIATNVIVLNRGAVVGRGTVRELLGASTGKVYKVVIDGKKADQAVASLASVERVDVMTTEGTHLTLSVVAKDVDHFLHDLSHLLGTHACTLRHLAAESGDLEHAFARLTRETEHGEEVLKK